MHELAALAEEQAAAEAAVAQAEADLKEKKETLRLLSEVAIPELWENAGYAPGTILKTKTGLSITVTETTRANISKDRMGPATAWLREHGHQFLIKRTLKVLPGDDEQGDELMRRFSDDGLDFSDETKVNAQSLSKFVREMLAEGEEVPQDLFGVYRQRKAKITN